MAVSSPGDALPCSLPRAAADKLRAIGVKSAVPGTPSASGNDSPTDSSPGHVAQTVDGRSVPLPVNPSVGGQVNLHV